jgi:tyrosyl-tRNA synthetase
MSANSNTSIVEELKWRGLIYDVMDGVEELRQNKRLHCITVLTRTADSLHVGHMFQ